MYDEISRIWLQLAHDQPAGSMGLSKIQNFIKKVFNFKIFIQLFQIT